jgi:hypothetical protein
MVQGVDDGSFLAPGHDGDVRFVQLLSQACAFDDPAAAFDAATDHFDGRAVIQQVWVPEE